MSSGEDNFVMLPPHLQSRYKRFMTITVNCVCSSCVVYQLLVISFACCVITRCSFLLCVASSLERSHSVPEALLRSIYYVRRRIWNCLHSPICSWLIAVSISVTFPSTSRYRVCAWKYSVVALIYFKVVSK
jgi:hypothetical protein